MEDSPAATQRKFFVGGNWKSNGSAQFAKDLIHNLLNKMKYDHDKIDLVVCPIYLHIALAKAMLVDNILVCSQNVSKFGNGAYTGEISAE